MVYSKLDSPKVGRSCIYIVNDLICLIQMIITKVTNFLKFEIIETNQAVIVKDENF